MLVLAQSDDAISERLAAELSEVETQFTAELVSDLSCVNQLVEHTEQYRGKMLRPTLVLVSAMASRPDDPTGSIDEAHRVAATVLEMVHMATLVHDDVLDEAQMRRGGATINHLRGNEAAVMLGDYLISHAYHLCSSLNRPHVSRLISKTTNTVCEGELLQLANRDNWDLHEDTYFEIIRRKTASLCGMSCRVAALLSDCAPEVQQRLDEYGEQLGIAFQIVDDVLDLTGEEQTVGKTLGRDLEKGKLTLPLIRYLASAGPAEREQFITWLDIQRDPAAEPERKTHALKQIHLRLLDSEAVSQARSRASTLVSQAKAGITDALPESPARALMLEMADAVLDRRF